jgi:FixJ family two-component response regulator
MKTSPNVFLVDDEPALLKALTRLLKTEGFQTQSYQSASDFLAAEKTDQPACLVLDVSMPEMTGMELQQHLLAEDSLISIIFLSGNGDIPMSVRAIKSGAVDFLTKPVKDSELLTAIHLGLKRAQEKKENRKEIQELKARLALLTPRESQVFLEVVSGKPNKLIADQMKIGEQTIKVHRSRVMQKMGSDSLAQLVLTAERLGLTPSAKVRI